MRTASQQSVQDPSGVLVLTGRPKTAPTQRCGDCRCYFEITLGLKMEASRDCFWSHIDHTRGFRRGHWAEKTERHLPGISWRLFRTGPEGRNGFDPPL